MSIGNKLVDKNKERPQPIHQAIEQKKQSRLEEAQVVKHVYNE